MEAAGAVELPDRLQHLSGVADADWILLALFRFGRHSWLKLTDVRLSLFLIFTINVLVFGTVFVYVQMKTRLEERNRELQGQVQLGQVQRQRQEAELDQAHEIQMHLLPRETPQIEGFQIACAWQPAKAVSGDYFDVFPFKDGRMVPSGRVRQRNGGGPADGEPAGQCAGLRAGRYHPGHVVRQGEQRVVRQHCSGKVRDLFLCRHRREDTKNAV